jgi:hypothetical protein
MIPTPASDVARLLPAWLRRDAYVLEPLLPLLPRDIDRQGHPGRTLARAGHMVRTVVGGASP